MSEAHTLQLLAKTNRRKTAIPAKTE